MKKEMTPEQLEGMFEKLECYAAAALSGMMANPVTFNPQMRQYWEQKKLSPEKLAILAAVEVFEHLEVYKEKMRKGEIESEPEKTGPTLVTPSGAPV